jgi:hypothetical protein
MVSAVTVVIRQAGFAVGIAVLGAVLHAEGSAISYVWLFSVAAIASIAGLVAALALLPAQAVRHPRKRSRHKSSNATCRPAVTPPSDG